MSSPLREQAVLLDREDELAFIRRQFHLPEAMIYLCGNSLGAMPLTAERRIAQVLASEWGEGLVGSWNSAGWIELPRMAAARLAPLIGTDAELIAVTDSTSINLFKVLAAAAALNPGRNRIVSERDNFPTDLYIADGLIRFLGKGHELVLVGDPAEIPAAIDGSTAILMLSHVNYRTGTMHDMAALTRIAQEKGALAVWDLAHSAGAVEIDLDGCGADFSVGCGYKYLNGGPGAPAFLHVAERHLANARQPLSGWFSHREPFAFTPDYDPADGIARFHTGTPPILSLAAFNEALDLWQNVDMAAIRRKSISLTRLFIEAVETLCPQVELVTPREPERRGSQICLVPPGEGHAIMQALIARGVIGDFRAPDIIRFGFAPLYNSHTDAFGAAEALAEILDGRLWDNPEYRKAVRVT